MPARPTRLERLLTVLARSGEADGPPRDPWNAILWENVAYLCNDAAREAAFAELQRATGLRAERIAAAKDAALLAACEHGKLALQRVAKLRECAALFESVGDPRELVKLPLAAARKTLRHFPGIGAPGAERLILFAGSAPLVALESNGLRALLRLGYGREAGNYAASYRAACAAAEQECASDVEARIALYLLARRLGQTVCRATPKCARCELALQCPSRIE